MGLEQAFSLARDIATVLSIVLSFGVALAILWLKSMFVPKTVWDNQLAVLQNTMVLNAEKFSEEIDTESSKRRSLQEQVVRMEETLKHVPSTEQVNAIMIELGKAHALLAQLAERFDDAQETLRREVDAVKHLVGHVQDTLSMVHRGSGS